MPRPIDVLWNFVDVVPLKGLSVLREVVEMHVDPAPHKCREDALPLFVVVLDLADVAGKRLRRSDETIEVIAMRANFLLLRRSLNS